MSDKKKYGEVLTAKILNVKTLKVALQVQICNCFNSGRTNLPTPKMRVQIYQVEYIGNGHECST